MVPCDLRVGDKVIALELDSNDFCTVHVFTQPGSISAGTASLKGLPGTSADPVILDAIAATAQWGSHVPMVATEKDRRSHRCGDPVA